MEHRHATYFSSPDTSGASFSDTLDISMDVGTDPGWSGFSGLQIPEITVTDFDETAIVLRSNANLIRAASFEDEFSGQHLLVAPESRGRYQDNHGDQEDQVDEGFVGDICLSKGKRCAIYTIVEDVDEKKKVEEEEEVSYFCL